MSDARRTPYHQPHIIAPIGDKGISLRFLSTQERDEFQQKLEREREQADGR